jgi:hypothetical protein
MLGVVIIVISVVLLVAELFVYDQAWLWHGEKKRDPRNFGPRR